MGTHPIFESDFDCLTDDMTDYLPGTAGLIEEIDKKHLVVLRDGRTLIGILRAIDQFANLVLHQTVERIHVDGFFGDIPRGIFVVRGENVALFGEVDLENENRGNLQEVSVEEILELHQQATARKDELERRKSRAMRERGLIPHQDVPDDLYF